ncbi:hypothetical protein J8273_2757 [Carpediemonas membranifera]|uniref:TOG domain-containing protein n=1 Tax=Carpediemonas membranifera TaxID=201153 RepID=A0A8J6EB02_9EUKA|nr:hypothetical protein J8273_2757 [Carpediemonas membranifera]|eukprot:KAG9395845.1 hypothetical protein J8273_2757 [Carpediemonas membranifera]
MEELGDNLLRLHEMKVSATINEDYDSAQEMSLASREISDYFSRPNEELLVSLSKVQTTPIVDEPEPVQQPAARTPTPPPPVLDDRQTQPSQARETYEPEPVYEAVREPTPKVPSRGPTPAPVKPVAQPAPAVSDPFASKRITEDTPIMPKTNPASIYGPHTGTTGLAHDDMPVGGGSGPSIAEYAEDEPQAEEEDEAPPPIPTRESNKEDVMFMQGFFGEDFVRRLLSAKHRLGLVAQIVEAFELRVVDRPEECARVTSYLFARLLKDSNAKIVTKSNEAFTAVLDLLIEHEIDLGTLRPVVEVCASRLADRQKIARDTMELILVVLSGVIGVHNIFPIVSNLKKTKNQKAWGNHAVLVYELIKDVTLSLDGANNSVSVKVLDPFVTQLLTSTDPDARAAAIDILCFVYLLPDRNAVVRHIQSMTSKVTNRPLLNTIASRLSEVLTSMPDDTPPDQLPPSMGVVEHRSESEAKVYKLCVVG